MPDIEQCNHKPPLVCTLVYDQLCTFEYAIAVELFALQRAEFEQPLYRFKSVAVNEGPMKAIGGLAISADGNMNQLRNADLIVVPGWRSVHEIPSPQLLSALVNANKRGARILSICSGVFPLACAGLLDGKEATTHWRYTKALQTRFPQIKVKPDVLFVDSGDVLTSAGSAAGIDLCLHVIRQDYGSEAANKIAKSLVLPAQRAGGQAQFAPRKTPECPDNGFGFILDHLRANLSKDWSVESIAEYANLSPRTLLRRFKSLTGESPITWLKNERLNYASELLETTKLNIDQISHVAGFSAPETFRLHFKNCYQVSPSHYRGQYQSQM